MNNLKAVDAEISLLSIILTNPDLAYNIPNLKSFMFDSSVHQSLYKNIQEIVQEGLVPEVNFVLNYLQNNGKLTDCGGSQFLDYLKNQVNDKKNLKDYENQIISAYKARELVAAGAQISSKVFTGNVDEYISNLRQTLDALSQTSGGNNTVALGDALVSTWEVINSRIGKAGLTGISTGINNLDVPTGGIMAGEEWVIAGRPGMGKSALLCNSVLGSAKLGNPCLIFSLEMNRQTINERFIAIESGVSLQDIRLGLLSQKQLDDVSDSIKRIKDLPIYLDCNFTPNVDYILGNARKYKSTKDIKLIFIDYLQLLAERDNDQTMELGRITRAMKLLSQEIEVGTVLCSQLSRLVEQRPDKRPILSDLRQSGNIEEDADVVAFLYRDEYYNPDKNANKGSLEFLLRKNRNGPVGTIPLKFDGMTNKITGR
jgi:replicative DNA helicase